MHSCIVKQPVRDWATRPWLHRAQSPNPCPERASGTANHPMLVLTCSVYTACHTYTSSWVTVSKIDVQPQSRRDGSSAIRPDGPDGMAMGELRLQAGERLTRDEFERRYATMPPQVKAELIEGVVYMPSPVRVQHHAEPHGAI